MKAFILVFLVAFTFTGCGGGGSNQSYYQEPFYPVDPGGDWDDYGYDVCLTRNGQQIVPAADGSCSCSVGDEILIGERWAKDEGEWIDDCPYPNGQCMITLVCPPWTNIVSNRPFKYTPRHRGTIQIAGVWRQTPQGQPIWQDQIRLVVN